MKAIRVHKHGGPEALQLDDDVPIPTAGPNEVIIDVAMSGLNYIDTYHRTGLYQLPMPARIGREGAGVVSAVGKEVKDVKIGTRVAFEGVMGSYGEKVAIAANRLIPIPDKMNYAQAASAPLQGLTAHYLVTASYPIKKGDIVLIHAGAGGTGGLVIQMAKLLGATVITTVSTEEKAKLCKEDGADHVINYAEVDFLQEVKKITNGEGCHAVYDGVGKATWEKSLQCVRRRGTLVLFGNASGPVPPFDPLLLTRHGSLFLTRPTLNDFTHDLKEFKERTAQLFDWIEQGKVKLRIAKVFPLAQAPDAHRFLEGRKALGKVLLDVNASKL